MDWLIGCLLLDLSVCLFVGLPVVSVCLSVWLSVRLSVYVSLSV